MSDDPIRRALALEPVPLPAPPGTAEAVLATARRQRRVRVVSLVAAPVLALAVGAGTALSLTEEGREVLLPAAETPRPRVSSPSVATPSTSPRPTSLAAAPGRCAETQLVVSNGEPYGTLGHTGLVLRFRNTGGSACLLAPYAGVAALDGAGTLLARARATPHGYLGGAAPRTLHLAPGAVASALLEGLDKPVDGTCTPIATFLVSPPGTSQPTRVPAGPFCAERGVEIHPVVPGSRGLEPEDDQQRVRLSSTEVAGVRLGTEAVAAERDLRAVLGPPSSKRSSGCGDEPGWVLTWGTLRVVLSLEAGRGVLSGWSLEAGTAGFAYDLPYDVPLGASVPDLLARVPHATGLAGEGATDGSYVVTTAPLPGLVWTSPDPDGRGRVEAVEFNGASCD